MHIINEQFRTLKKHDLLVFSAVININVKLKTNSKKN